MRVSVVESIVGYSKHKLNWMENLEVHVIKLSFAEIRTLTKLPVYLLRSNDEELSPLANQILVFTFNKILFNMIGMNGYKVCYVVLEWLYYKSIQIYWYYDISLIHLPFIHAVYLFPPTWSDWSVCDEQAFWSKSCTNSQPWWIFPTQRGRGTHKHHSQLCKSSKFLLNLIYIYPC